MNTKTSKPLKRTPKQARTGTKPRKPYKTSLALRKEAEETIEVQKLLKTELSEDEKVFVVNEKPKPGRKASAPLLAKRNEFIVGLHVSGLTIRTIQRQVNLQATTKGWGMVHHERTIQRAIAKHFAKQLPSTQERQRYDDSLREAMFTQQEAILERLIINTKKKEKSKWKPFEEAAAMDTIFKMQQQIIENRNWNESKKNPNINLNLTNNNLSVFTDTAVERRESTLKNPALDRIKGFLSNKFEKKDLLDEDDEEVQEWEIE